MLFKAGRNKYVPDRSFGSRKLFVFREATHARLLKKCKDTVWPDGPEGASYFLADVAGIIIPDVLIIDQPDGSDKRLDWTLDAYIRVSRIKYQSKARFNVLMKPQDCK